jgi:hypothetical protein
MVAVFKSIGCLGGETRMETLVQKLAARLRLGQLPEALRAELEAEGRLLYLAQGIRETAIFRHYRASGVYSGYRRMGFIGYFALSERRLVAKAKCYHEIDVSVAYDEALFQQMTFTVRPRYLALAFDASARNAAASGQIEVRLHLPDIRAAAQLLEQAGARFE